MAKFLRDNGLSLALGALFLGTILGMALTGLASENADLAAHGQPPQLISTYLASGAFLSPLFENWESEFLQMAVYVLLTAMLFQRGSAESHDPDDPSRPNDRLPGHGPRVWLCEHSLSLALAALFLLSFLLHAGYSVADANEEALLHGQPARSFVPYLLDPHFWFESFQNWQSEFLSTAALVLLSIFLRQRGSPESKPVAAPNSQTGT